VTAELSEIVGGVLARDAQQTAFSQVAAGYVLGLLGQIQTESNGKVRLDFSTGTLMRLGPGTLFTLQAPKTDSAGVLNRLQMDVGKLWIILRGGTLQVDTPSGVAAVQGSLMSVDFGATDGNVRVTCLEGHCSLTNPAGTVHITAGQTADTSTSDNPPRIGQMTEQDYLDWLANMPESAPYIPGLYLHRPQSGEGSITSSPTQPPAPPTPPPSSGSSCQTNCGVGAGNGGAGNGTGNEGKGSSGSGNGNHIDGNRGSGKGNGGPIGLTGSSLPSVGDPPFPLLIASATWL